MMVVPPPDELVFLSWLSGGDVFRSGCGYRRIFYFRPGHEPFPTYHDPVVLKVIANAVRWAAPTLVESEPFQNRRVVPPLEPI